MKRFTRLGVRMIIVLNLVNCLCHVSSSLFSSDCPQVQAVFDYKAQQPDELDLQRDVVKVYRKMADGKKILNLFRVTS